MTEYLLRLDQLAKALNLPRGLLVEIPPARPSRGRYMAFYSLAAAREYLRQHGIAFGPDTSVPT